MTEAKKSDEEIQAWLDQVHFGSCCSDDPDDCPEEEKGPSNSENPVSEAEPEDNSKS